MRLRWTTDRAAPDGDRSLRILIASSVLSKIGDWQLGIVIPLAVLAQTKSVAAALMAVALRGVAFAASPLLGALIDRYDRRRVFVVAQTAQALCLGLVAIMLANSWAVAVLLLLSGFGGVAVNLTGQFVLIPTLVDLTKRSIAVAKLNSAIEYSKVAGLILGGVVISVRGPAVAAWCTSALFGASAMIALLLPAARVDSVRRRLRDDLTVGFRWVKRRDVLWLMLTMAVANLAVGQLEAVLVTLLDRAQMLPILISAILAVGLAVGGVGSRLSPLVLRSRSAETRILFFQAMALVALLIISIPQLLATISGYVCYTFAIGGSNVASITYRQEIVPVELAGRVNSVIRMFIAGAVPLSGVVYALASRLPGWSFWIPALTLSAAALLIWMWYLLGAHHDYPAPERVAAS